MMLVLNRFEPAFDLLETTMAQPQPETPTTTTGGSDGGCRDHERRIKRKLSNRESARRSRIRKRRHLAELKGEADRLGSQNRELVNRICGANQCSLLLHRDSDRLRREQAYLSRRLSDARRILVARLLEGLNAACGDTNVSGFLTANELLLT